jgi:hypothetical protein
MHYISWNRPSLILHLMIGYQILHIGHNWEKKTIEELQSILSSSLQLLTDVPTLSEYIQTLKFAAKFHSICYCEFKSGKVKKYNAWNKQHDIDLVMKRALYMCNLLFII